jgi:hypothetical protein
LCYNSIAIFLFALKKIPQIFRWRGMEKFGGEFWALVITHTF